MGGLSPNAKRRAVESTVHYHFQTMWGNRRRRIGKKNWLDRRARRISLAGERPGYRGPRTPMPFVLDAYTWESIKRSPDQQTYELTLPKTLDFEDNYESTASNFHLLRMATNGQHRVTKLRFDLLESISPAAALVLASEVARWKQRIGGNLRADIASWKPAIRVLLCEMGYFELLGLQRPVHPMPPGNIRFLQFIEGESGPTLTAASRPKICEKRSMKSYLRT